MSKRLEIYLGWKCNHKCLFCIEELNIERFWDIEYSGKEILKKLQSYKKKGYDHVTFLGGEPFIQKNFQYSIRAAKALGFTLLVTTNATTLQVKKNAKETLPYIDELIISLPSLDPENQTYVNHTKNPIDYDKVFDNIQEYFSGNFVKVNTIIGKYNCHELVNIVQFLGEKGVKEISFTYPDYGKWAFEKADKVFMRYTELLPYLESAYDMGQKFGMTIRLCDIPLCCSGKLYPVHEDLYYDNRLKVGMHQEEEHYGEEVELDRNKKAPRSRRQVEKCKGCKVNKYCWGPGHKYVTELFDDSEIAPCDIDLEGIGGGIMPESCLLKK